MYCFNNNNIFISFFKLLNLQIKKIICQLVTDANARRHLDMFSAQEKKTLFVLSEYLNII